MKILYQTFLALGLLLTAAPLLADIVYLRNGEAIIGRISGQAPDSITVRTDEGYRKVIKRRIQRIAFNTSKQEEQRLKNQITIQEMLDWQPQLDRVLKTRRQEQKSKEEQILNRREEESHFFYDETLELKERARRGALYRSLTLPGWGQFYKRQDWKAWGIIGLSVGGAGAAYYGLKQYSTEADSYNQSNMEYIGLFYWRHDILYAYPYISSAMEARSGMISNAQMADGALIFLTVLYGLNVLDAYYTDVELGMGRGNSGSSAFLRTGQPKPFIRISADSTERNGSGTDASRGIRKGSLTQTSFAAGYRFQF